MESEQQLAVLYPTKMIVVSERLRCQSKASRNRHFWTRSLLSASGGGLFDSSRTQPGFPSEVEDDRSRGEGLELAGGLHEAKALVALTPGDQPLFPPAGENFTGVRPVTLRGTGPCDSIRDSQA
jgi:hypothetical protein